MHRSLQVSQSSVKAIESQAKYIVWKMQLCTG
jgi:hypothetical protein